MMVLKTATRSDGQTLHIINRDASCMPYVVCWNFNGECWNWGTYCMTAKDADEIFLQKCKEYGFYSDGGGMSMTKTIKINVEETLTRLAYWLDKVEDCYKEEVAQSMTNFKKEYGLK